MNNKMGKIISFIKENKLRELYPYISPLEYLGEKADNVDPRDFDDVINNMHDLIHNVYNALPFEEKYDKEKLMLYNACIYYIKKSLIPKETTQYEFLLFPGEIENTEVLDIYYEKAYGKGRHIFKIDVRKDMMSDSQNIIILLCHELAHYVGSEIRSREKRLESFYKICTRIIVLGIKTNLMQLYNGNVSGDFWNIIEKNLPEWIKKYYERVQNDDYNKCVGSWPTEKCTEITEFNKANMRHMFFIRPMITDCVADLLEYKWQKIFEPLIINGMNDKTLTEKEDMVKKSIQKMMEYSNVNNRIFNFSNVLKLVEYPIKESYADMISILELQLSPKEYFGSIISCFPSVEPEEYSIKICARIAIVVVVMSYKKDGCDLGYTWETACLQELHDDGSAEGGLYRHINDYIHNCIKKSYIDTNDINDKNKKLKDLFEEYEILLCDNQVNENIIGYLLTCKENFQKHLHSDSCKANGEIVKELYKGENVKSHIERFEEFIKGIN